MVLLSLLLFGTIITSFYLFDRIIERVVFVVVSHVASVALSAFKIRHFLETQ
ncbi:hypothetical protein JCM19235_2709 [Vibrio maritimus]|uniref:Uncharacterized protein n=1 Tax=Vibrio maritimus TaxID=990268 RepID=A0A090RVG7_9VIBR|nr:hypothetical protein JCM19235_2709 [Vibrio maritimus]